MPDIKSLIASIKSGEGYTEEFDTVWKGMLKDRLEDIKVDLSNAMFNGGADDSEGIDEAISPKAAHEFLTGHGMIDKDYHSGNFDYKHELRELARKSKYRKGASSPGSLTRAFHTHLTKQAEKYLKDAKAEEIK